MQNQSTSKKIVKQIVGKKGSKHLNEMMYTIRLYKMRNEMQRVPRFLIYYFYKILMCKIKVHSENSVIVNDYKMKLIPNDEGISKELRVFHVHEPLLTQIIKNEIKDGMTCVEVGCNIGYYALLESKLVGKNGKVIAIEPSPINFNCFKKNLELNKISNVEPFNFAVGNSNVMTNFFLSNISNWSKVIEKPLSNSDKNVIRIPLKKLDTFYLEHNLTKIDFIRMDIEGYEFKAYEGMKEIIKKYKPRLMIEVHSTLGNEQTIEFFKKLQDDGYQSKYLIPRGLDWPWVYDANRDIIKTTLNDIIERISNGNLLDDFNLFLN
jgi:FkbM family methyltransferase